MNMKKDIYDDASLIKKSLLKDLSEEDRMEVGAVAGRSVNYGRCMIS